MSDIAFESVTPILPVASVRKALAHYVDVLGFEQDWPGEENFASISRGRCHLFLAEGDQGRPGTWVWIGVSDVDRLHADYARRGVKVRHPPTNYPWAREMQVEDLDGNVLRMGCDRRAGEPNGEWLDMRGVRWRRDEDGNWSSVGG